MNGPDTYAPAQDIDSLTPRNTPIGQDDSQLRRPLEEPYEIAFMHQIVYGLVDQAASQLTDVQLGFMAKSVTLNNLSGQWFYMPFLFTYLPPYVVGWTRQILASGTQKVTFKPETPIGMTSTPTPGQTVQACFYSLSVTPDNGIQFKPVP